jgi:hypothetical protein
MSHECRVFLAGEGVSDIGDLARPAGFRDGGEGFLQPILRSIVGDGFDLVFEGAKLTMLAKTRVRTPAALFTRHAAQAYALAEVEECAAVVFATDVDRERGTKRTRAEARERIATLRSSIKRGFADAAAESGRDLLTVIATPCRTIEAWALGDPAALGEVAGERVDPTVCSRPEDRWGDEDDPDSDHPKRMLQRIVGDRPDLATIAELASPEAVAAACPLSFAPFVKEVQTALSRCEADRSGP